MKDHPSIAITNFSFSYLSSEEPVISGMNLAIPRGKVVGIMGPVGAGKSTLVYALGGFIPGFLSGTHSGSILIEDHDPLTSSPRQMADIIGLVFQDFEAQLFSSTCELEIAFAMENRGIDPATMKRRVWEILAQIGLSGYATRSPGTLSGGQKQRLVIGAVLALYPKILCFDEPVTDLDPVGKEEVFSLISSINRGEAGSSGDRNVETGIIIEQETEEMTSVDCLILIEKGAIIAKGTPREVIRDVPLFQRLGLRPLPVCEYYHYLGIDDGGTPLTALEAESIFHKTGLKIDSDRYTAILENDQIRTAAYGKEVISIKNLSFGYEEKRILQEMDLVIRRHECVAIIGPNGSGKTTLSRQLIGLIRPDTGSITIADMDTRTSSIHQLSRVIGYVFQNPDHQIFSDTVFEEVAYGVRLHGFTPDEVRRRVTEALAAVGLSGREEFDPFSLPKGDRQRVAVASVLAIQPEIIVLDEPTTGLDYHDQIRMMELLVELNRKGHTIIIITHAMWMVAGYMHRVVVLKDGRVRADDTPRKIFTDPELMAETSIKPPQITTFSRMIGYPMLSVQEMVACTARRDRR